MRPVGRRVGRIKERSDAAPAMTYRLPKRILTDRPVDTFQREQREPLCGKRVVMFEDE